MTIIIPTYASDFAIEISSINQYFNFIEKQDIKNVKSILELIDLATENTMKKYLAGTIARNIIKNNVVGGSTNSIYRPFYKDISIAVEGEKYRSLVSKIDGLRNEDKSIISYDAKKLLGESIISFSPTPRELIGNNIPMYSFRFVWKDDADYPNSRVNDLVLGIHDKLK